MKILSLFDGISCGQQALKNLNLPIEKYYAAEIDKHAIKVTTKNHPNTIQIGTVTDVKYKDGILYTSNGNFEVDKIDLLIGGSPCQGFSFAGKQLNFEDPRSKLFFEYVRLLKEIRVDNPDALFLLENVKMKKEYQDVITGILGIQPIEINSALLSAQNRKRLYWTNIKDVKQPDDKGILLKDIVHETTGPGLSGKELGYMLKSNDKWLKNRTNRLECYLNHPHKKHHCLTANFCKGVPYNAFYEQLNSFVVPFDKTLQILDKEVERGKIETFKLDAQGNRVYFIHGNAVTLGRDVKDDEYLFGCLTPDRLDKRQNGQRFNDGQKFYTLTAQDKHGILIEGYIRKITPIECERLQTLPDNYTEGISNTQRYKALGNGWTVDVISHIFKNI